LLDVSSAVLRRWVTEALAAESGRAKGPARERKNAVKRRLILMLSLGVAAAAYADPAFGPGNNGGAVGNSGPREGKCHPLGQTHDTPGCK
jgi:hypothetical protein